MLSGGKKETYINCIIRKVENKGEVTGILIYHYIPPIVVIKYRNGDKVS